MMEYVQMTLSDWLNMKQKLQAELLGVRKSFVRIGYILRKIDESKGYENDGYKTIAEWAKGEYGLEGSTVSRFMSINKEYSVGGFSEELLPEYEDFKRSQLEEMLKLPASDREMIRPETSRQSIRDLKQFNKEQPEAGGVDSFVELVAQFFYCNQDLLREIYENPAFEDRNENALKELVNPSGNRTFKKGLYFLMMYESGLKVKKFGGTPEDKTWKEFFDAMISVYGEELQEEMKECSEEESQNREEEQEYGEEKDQERQESGSGEAEEGAFGGEDRKDEQPDQTVEEGTSEISAKEEHEREEKEEIAPAQNSAERLEEEDDFEGENVEAVSVTHTVIEDVGKIVETGIREWVEEAKRSLDVLSAALKHNAIESALESAKSIVRSLEMAKREEN